MNQPLQIHTKSGKWSASALGLAGTFLFCLTAGILLAQTLPVPTDKETAAPGFPAWWFERGVISQLADPPDTVGPTTYSDTPGPTDYHQPDDYAAINQGQLKHISRAAYDELQARLPASVWATTEGQALTSLVTGWYENGDLSGPVITTGTDPYAAANLGQVKYIASHFYDVLALAGYAALPDGSNPPAGWTSGNYPWSASATPADDYAAANLGQLKYLFSWDLRADSEDNGDGTFGDGLPDWWELYHFEDLDETETTDFDNDGSSNWSEFQRGSDPTDPLDGILSHLRGYWSMNEGAGTVAEDNAVWGNHGTLINGVSWNPPSFDSTHALTFDGMDAYVEIGDPVDDSLDFGATQSFAISAWFKTTGTDGQRIVSKGNIGWNSGYMLALSNTGSYPGEGKVAFGVGGEPQGPANTTFVATQNTFNDGSWHHVVAVYDRSQKRIRLYLDGQPQPLEKVTTSGHPTGGTLVNGDLELDFSGIDGVQSAETPWPFCIGAGKTSGGTLYDHFDGEIDDVRIYTLALSPQEISDLFTNDVDSDGLPDTWEQQIIDADPADGVNSIEDVLPADDFDGDGLENSMEHQNGTNPVQFDGAQQSATAYFTFEEGSGTTIVDSSGSGNDGFRHDGEWAAGLNDLGLTTMPRMSVQNSGNAILPPTGEPFSISGWFQLNTLTTEVRLLNNEDPQNHGFRFFVVGPQREEWKQSRFQFETEVGGGSTLVRSSTLVVPGHWYHVAITYDGGSETSIYVNGQLEGTDTTSAYVGNTLALEMGYGIGGASYVNFDGTIDNLGIFSSALTGEQVQQLYESEVETETHPDGLPDWWEQSLIALVAMDNDPSNDYITTLDHINASSDFDRDGALDGEEFASGSDATDYYDRPDGTITPALAIVSGNHQPGPPGELLSSPLVVQVTNPGNGNAPLVGAPVTFSITAGNGLLILYPHAPTDYSAVTVLADHNGMAQVFGVQSTDPSPALKIQSSAGNVSTNFETSILKLSDPIFISVNEDNSFIGKSDGTFWSAGDSYLIGAPKSQSGNFDEFSHWSTFHRVAQLSSYRNDFCLALDQFGRVWSWGNNGYGELGDLSRDHTRYPKLSTLNGIQQVSTGFQFGLALSTEGKVYSWGNTGSGRLGRGSSNSDSQRRPQEVLYLDDSDAEQVLTDVVKIVSGRRHSLALDSNDDVWSWGYGYEGRLGHGNFENQNYAKKITDYYDLNGTKINGGISADDIAAGYEHSLILSDSGLVFAFGNDSEGQLGNGDSDTSNHSSPKQIVIQGGTSQIFANEYQSFAIKSNGHLVAWGHNTSGELGVEDQLVRTEPTDVPTINAEIDLGATILSFAPGSRHTLVALSDGSLWAWGDNSKKQQGIPSRSSGDHSTPMQVPNVQLFVDQNDTESMPDSVPDDWENYHFNGDLTRDLATSDGDGDGLYDLEEYQNNTDPTDADTDGDGIEDDDESGGLDPANRLDGFEDWDGDGYLNNFEIAHGSLMDDSTSIPDGSGEPHFFTVGVNGDYTDLQEAINFVTDDSQSGTGKPFSILKILPGTLEINTQIDITDSDFPLMIVGSKDPWNPSIFKMVNTTGSTNTFRINDANVVFDGLIFEYGEGAQRSALNLISSRVWVFNSIFRNIRSYYGAIQNGGLLSITHCTFYNVEFLSETNRGHAINTRPNRSTYANHCIFWTDNPETIYPLGEDLEDSATVFVDNCVIPHPLNASSQIFQSPDYQVAGIESELLTSLGFSRNHLLVRDQGRVGFQGGVGLFNQSRAVSGSNFLPDIGAQEYLDADGDGLPASLEAAEGTSDQDPGDPGSIGQTLDFDSDGMADYYELTNGGNIFEPLDVDSDYDEDGLSLMLEFSYGSSGINPDSNGDGLADGPAHYLGYNPTSIDNDGDGLSNVEEFAIGTNPFWEDTDGDDTLDGADYYPFDPHSWDPPGVDPADQTGPVILRILEPANATLIP